MKGLPVAAAVAVFLAVAVVAAGAASSQARLAGTAAGCSARAAKALVREFAADYSRGRLARADRLWAPAGRFQWYSTGGAGRRLGAAAEDRATLASYLRGRAGRHERIRITKLTAISDAERNLVHFSGTLQRTADDIPQRPPQDFKGAADCVSGRPLLIVWSM